MKNESPIFNKTHDIILWLLNHTDRFPTRERFRLAKRLEDAIFQTHELLMAAAIEKDVLRLDRADYELKKMRFYLRLAQERGLFNLQQYKYIISQTLEVGRLLGAWKKSLSCGTNTSTGI